MRLVPVPKTLRLHDLRHSFASTLVSEGASLYAVGKLLGHTRHQTTQRYAHLAPQALQETTERLGKAYSPMLQ
jgi:site-specific recombinase XerD